MCFHTHRIYTYTHVFRLLTEKHTLQVGVKTQNGTLLEFHSAFVTNKKHNSDLETQVETVLMRRTCWNSCGLCGWDVEEMCGASVRLSASLCLSDRLMKKDRHTKTDSSMDFLRPFIYQSQQAPMIFEDLWTPTKVHTLTLGASSEKQLSVTEHRHWKNWGFSALLKGTLTPVDFPWALAAVNDLTFVEAAVNIQWWLLYINIRLGLKETYGRKV